MPRFLIDRKRALELYDEGMQQATIARRLNCHPSTIYSMLRKHRPTRPRQIHRPVAICGTPTMYNRGCRCGPCTIANRERWLAWSHRSLGLPAEF